jgi:hypothetical protein
MKKIVTETEETLTINSVCFSGGPIYSQDLRLDTSIYVLIINKQTQEYQWIGLISLKTRDKYSYTTIKAACKDSDYRYFQGGIAELLGPTKQKIDDNFNK